MGIKSPLKSHLNLEPTGGVAAPTPPPFSARRAGRADGLSPDTCLASQRLRCIGQRSPGPNPADDFEPFQWYVPQVPR
jgi:hypothetical protein